MLYYAYGSALLTAEEVLDPSIFEPLTGFFKTLEGGGKPQALELPGGKLDPDNAIKNNTFADNLIPFQPVGSGKPLTLMISEVYTGMFPKPGGIFGGNTKDMLVTSAVKSIVTTEGKPRALNMLKQDVARNTRPTPAAVEKGGPLIFYSPALIDISLTLDLTMAFDSFDQQVFDQIGGALSEIAGVPLFATQSFYLIAGGMIMKLIGRLGEAIFDRTPEFNSSETLNISLPGRPPLPAGYLVVTNANLTGAAEAEFRKKHHVNNDGTLVDSGGNQYQGAIPYILVTADGTPQDSFKDFTPTAASAAVLSRFFNIKEDQSLELDIVIDALKLYNDIKFRTEIDQLDEKIKGMKDDDPKKAELVKKREALLANILEEKLKPKA